MKQLRNRFLIITSFAIAMGLFEAAVVIYLREIMYPGGFEFPLAPVLPHLAVTEILREASTMIMLICIGLLAARTFSQRFAWFMYSFAIWDIFYYVFLWLLIGWPESIMTWDVLFLIPATWTGPVITPLLITAVLILFAIWILVPAEKGMNTKIRPLEWVGLSAGSAVVIVAFITDYMKHMLERFTFSEMLKAGNTELLAQAETYTPGKFPWPTFIAGLAVILFFVIRFRVRIKSSRYA